jgi:hypothetical protein
MMMWVELWVKVFGPMSRNSRSIWWAQQDSNLRLPPCEGGTLPLSYAPFATLPEPGNLNTDASQSCGRRAAPRWSMIAPLAHAAKRWRPDTVGCGSPSVRAAARIRPKASTSFANQSKPSYCRRKGTITA